MQDDPNFDFSPKTVTINVGETVTWTNDGKVPEGHTATGDSFDSGVLKEGQTYIHKFTRAGSFDYVCTLHPMMKGTIVVKGTSGGGGNGGGVGRRRRQRRVGNGNGGSGGGGNSSGGGSGGSGTSGDRRLQLQQRPSSLPITGEDLVLLLILGVNLVLGGTLLLLRSRYSRLG